MIAWNPEPSYVGRHRAPRPAAPLAPALTWAEVETVKLFTFLRHVADGQPIPHARDLARIDVADIRTAQAVSS